MPIVEKICSFPPSALDRTEEDGKELLNLCRTLMDMVNIPSNAEIYEIPLMKNNQVVIYFFLENDDEKEYCLNAGHWLDDTISMKLEAYGKETHEYDIEMYTAFESLPLDYFENHETNDEKKETTMNKNYYGTEFYGTEKWEEQKKGILAEMREKYRNVNVEDVDILETMPFDHDGLHATGYEVLINGDWVIDYEEEE